MWRKTIDDALMCSILKAISIPGGLVYPAALVLALTHMGRGWGGEDRRLTLCHPEADILFAEVTMCLLG